jgi:hypothetical protein
MKLSKEICKECSANEPVTYPGGGESRVPVPWRTRVEGTEDDDELWVKGRVICPNGASSIDQIPPDCLRKRKQRAFFEMTMWIEDEVPR